MSPEQAPSIGNFRKYYLLKKELKEPISSLPVFIVPGFGCNGEAYQRFAEQLNSQGLNTVTPTYNLDRLDGFRNLPYRLSVDLLKQRSDLEIVKAEGRVDVVAHSKGAYDIAKVAIKHPENFRNIIMIAPGGLRRVTGPVKGVTSLMKGEHKDEDDKKRLIAEGDADTAKIIRINNMYGARYRTDKIRRTLEGITSGTKYIRKLLPELRKKGIKIVIICQKEDAMYPPESYDEFVRNNVDKFIEIPGIHGEIKHNPKVGQLVADLLVKMANNQPL